MIVLKIAQTDEGLAILLSPEAQQLLGARDGSQVGLEVSAEGDVVIAGRDMSFEARRERGRAFLQRFNSTFQALAK